MRRIFALLFLVLLLCGCTVQPSEPATITVSLAPTKGCHVQKNGLQISSGEDAVFELVLEDGYELAELDYDGEYEVENKSDVLYLRLKDVRYPTLAQIQVTSHFCTIYYEPNGGMGEPHTLTYDTQEHIRPNTSRGLELFTREGYTLTGWNTQADGTGEAVGLGSRVSVPEGELMLFAQWAAWTPETDFTWKEDEDGALITGYHGTDETVVVPGSLGGLEVTSIGTGAFADCAAEHIILPPTVKQVRSGAFAGCQMRELTFFDNIELFDDASFEGCPNFSTVHINAVEDPWGYDYRRESCLADKVDILIEAQGQKKIVFYGGCSMWYNLDGALAQEMIGEGYQVINLGLNGVMNSSAQVQILTQYLEAGDVFFHTPEVSSQAQMMQRIQMINHDRKLWCGMEYNYDLVAALDIRSLPDFFDILYYWLSTKEQTSSYAGAYRDYKGNRYVDEFGCASFPRTTTKAELDDKVQLDPNCFDPVGLSRMAAQYRDMMDRGVTVYVGHACINLDALPSEQRELVPVMDGLFREHFGAMEGVTVIGSMEDYLYHNKDFYDTNYHLLTEPAHSNTQLWMRDLTQQMEQDGLWPSQAE